MRGTGVFNAQLLHFHGLDRALLVRDLSKLSHDIFPPVLGGLDEVVALLAPGRLAAVQFESLLGEHVIRLGEVGDMDVIPDVVTLKHSEGLTALDDGLSQEGNLQAARLDRPTADTVDGNRRDDGGGDAVLEARGGDGGVGVGVHVRRVEGGDRSEVAGVVVDLGARVSEAVRHVVQDSGPGDVDVMALLALGHARNDGLANGNVVCGSGFCGGSVLVTDICGYVTSVKLTENDIGAFALLKEYVVGVEVTDDGLG